MIFQLAPGITEAAVRELAFVASDEVGKVELIPNGGKDGVTRRAVLHMQTEEQAVRLLDRHAAWAAKRKPPQAKMIVKRYLAPAQRGGGK